MLHLLKLCVLLILYNPNSAFIVNEDREVGLNEPREISLDEPYRRELSSEGVAVEKINTFGERLVPRLHRRQAEQIEDVIAPKIKSAVSSVVFRPHFGPPRPGSRPGFRTRCRRNVNEAQVEEEPNLMENFKLEKDRDREILTRVTRSKNAGPTSNRTSNRTSNKTSGGGSSNRNTNSNSRGSSSKRNKRNLMERIKRVASYSRRGPYWSRTSHPPLKG